VSGIAVDAETIESYFDRYGWQYDRLDDTHFVTGFKSEVTDGFGIYITLAPHWIYFSISPFVKAPDPECERNLYKHLLRLCQQMNMAKFAVDDDKDVMLAVELPRESLDFSEFSDALGALTYYADQTYETVHALAVDPSAVSGFSVEADLDWDG
jgi:hypothetical protein